MSTFQRLGRGRIIPSQLMTDGSLGGLGVGASVGGRWRPRSIRIAVLLSAIVILSLADLYMTLLHARTIGMGEMNPIAHYVISHNSPGLLIVWKMASVGLACMLFYVTRAKAFAEVGCWFCCLLLVWLATRWASYSDQLHTITPRLQELAEGESPEWVRMEP